MAKPLVSVLIPVYNAGEYLRPSLESILGQTYSNLEILIIDDGSTDGCMDSINDIEDYRIRIITQENSGKATAMNRGLEKLSGEFYVIQDADDSSYSHRIERQVKCLIENPDLAAVFTGHDLIIYGRRTAPRFAEKGVEQCREDIEQIRMPAHDPTGMFRVSAVRDMRYETTLEIGQGTDYILQVGERYPMIVLGECLYSYRIHYNSNTRNDPNLRKQMVRQVFKRACERRGLNPIEHLLRDTSSAAKRPHREQETGLVSHFMESILDLRRAGRRWESLKTSFTCLKLHPLDFYYYKPLCYFLAPFKIIKFYRSRKANCQLLPNGQS